ncbi:putative Polycomb group protein ASXL1 [Megalops cyprinoides]|uniref:putative Polycomb group protein ASXL1 n=1 Tax=Megalops cyprinoides TaxID=118141 RepID=UPI0018642411|nr:putative Polycomb group protein ASXL1 [Megalops cyprinoides]
MKDKLKRKKERTWAEAARMVLENFSDAPMTPKQILHVIQTKGLKEMRSGTAPLACLVTMLHSQVRGDRVKNSIFFKLPGRMSLFTLKKNALQWTKSPAAPEPVEAAVGAGPGAGTGEGAEQESCDSTETVTAGGENDVSVDETSSSASCSTEPQTRLSRSTQSGRQRKKAVMMPRVVLTPLKVNGEHVPSGPMKRSRGVEVDFETPGSILVNTNIRALINTRTFAAFPPQSQQQLLQLLPEVDRQVGADGLARLSSSALNNEFFTHASQSWKERLAEGEFTHEMQARFRQEMEKEKKVEAWKEKFFEEYHGQRSGLTLEESLKLTVEDSGDGVGSVMRSEAGVAPKRRSVGRRRRDGRMRRRSQADLRRRAKRPLCKTALAQHVEVAEKAPATPSGPLPADEAAPQGEVVLHTDSTGEALVGPAFTVPVPAPSPAATAAEPEPEVSARLHPEAEIPAASSSSSSSPSSSPSSSSDRQGTFAASSDPPSAVASLADPLDQEASVSTATGSREGSPAVSPALSPALSPAQNKEQKRKGEEPQAFTCFAEKRARLDDCQSFRNTIDCVHSEKPQPTTEEPKVPPIRIQLSRIKPPWVKGPPTYQICPRIVPPGEGSRRGGTGARTLADIKARAQQARAQREAAAAVAATGDGAGPGGGGPGGGAGVPDRSSGRRSREHPGPVEPGGPGGGGGGGGRGGGGGGGVADQGAAADSHQPGAQLLLPNVESATPPPQTSPQVGVSAGVLEQGEEASGEAALDPPRLPAAEAESDVRSDEQRGGNVSQDQTPAAEESSAQNGRGVAIEEAPALSGRAAVAEGPPAPSGRGPGAEVALTSIPDTLPRFGARGMDVIRTLTAPVPPSEGEQGAGGATVQPAGSPTPSSNSASEDEEGGLGECGAAAGQPSSGARLPGGAVEDAGAHSDSTETASDFENETAEEGANDWGAESDSNGRCIPSASLSQTHLPDAVHTSLQRISQNQSVIHAPLQNSAPSQSVIHTHLPNTPQKQAILQSHLPNAAGSQSVIQAHPPKVPPNQQVIQPPLTNATQNQPVIHAPLSNTPPNQPVIHAPLSNTPQNQPVIQAQSHGVHTHPLEAPQSQAAAQYQPEREQGCTATPKTVDDSTSAIKTDADEPRAPSKAPSDDCRASLKLSAPPLRKGQSSARQVSSVEANNPLVTQLLQGSLPLEKVLPQPHSASKLEINRLPAGPPPIPQHTPHPANKRDSSRQPGGPARNHTPRFREESSEFPPQSHPKASAVIRASPGAGRGFGAPANPAAASREGTAGEARAACLLEEASSRAAAVQQFLSQQGGAAAGAVPVITSLPSRRPAEFGQNAAFQSAAIKEHPTPQTPQGGTPERPAGGMGPLSHCRTTPDAPSPPHGDLCPSEVVPTVKINWRPKPHPQLSPAPTVKNEVVHPPCQALAKNSLAVTTTKKEAQNCVESRDSFLAGGGGAMEGLLNMEMSLLRMAKKEQGKPYPRPGDSSSSPSPSSSSSSLPFQVSVQQQLYSKLPKLQQGVAGGGVVGPPGFSYTANVSVVDGSGFSRNIADSVLQLRQGGRQSATLSIQAFADSAAEEVAFKCSCRLKAMIMCQGCGAFCHDDCIGPSKLCVSCLVVR